MPATISSARAAALIRPTPRRATQALVDMIFAERPVDKVSYLRERGGGGTADLPGRRVARIPRYVPRPFLAGARRVNPF